MPPPVGLDAVDVRSILRRLGPLASNELVLVGGQALNFWADYYGRQGRLGALVQEGPFTSKDIDFFGGPDSVEQCAVLLNGTYLKAGFDDPVPQSGTVTFRDDRGVDRTIDLLSSLYGVKTGRIQKTAIPFELEGTGLVFSVLHPVLCLFSRACNTEGLPGYDSEHALRQLRAAVACAQAFLADLAAAQHTRAVLRLNEQILSFAGRRVGLRLHTKYGIDVFEAVFVGDGLPSAFLAERYPRMLRWLEIRRMGEAARRRRDEQWQQRRFDRSPSSTGSVSTA